jgi:hypothetical protein
MVISGDMKDNELVCKHCKKRFEDLHGLQTHLGIVRKKAESFEEIRKIDEERARVRKLWKETWTEIKTK